MGLETRLDLVTNLLRQPGLINNAKLAQSGSFEAPNLLDNVESYPGPFGKGLLVSEIEGKAYVTVVESGDVVESVFASILNASQVLDVSRGGRGEYVFYKEDERSFSDDLQELQRLSGSHNVTVSNIRPRVRQLCAKQKSPPEWTVCFVYGPDKHTAARHTLRSAHKSAVNRAWHNEMRNLKSGFSQDKRWTNQQKNELFQTGQVRGFEGIEVHNTHKYPQFAGHASNILFVKQSEANQRRRS